MNYRGLRGAPTKVFQSDLTGPPYPADAEIVLEGEISPGELRDDGPFGEWPGYYASPMRISVQMAQAPTFLPRDAGEESMP